MNQAAATRQSLVNRYASAFRFVEAGAFDKARSTLGDLVADISARVVPDSQRSKRVIPRESGVSSNPRPAI